MGIMVYPLIRNALQWPDAGLEALESRQYVERQASGSCMSLNPRLQRENFHRDPESQQYSPHRKNIEAV